jgi:hypothetical protein
MGAFSTHSGATEILYGIIRTRTGFSGATTPA